VAKRFTLAAVLFSAIAAVVVLFEPWHTVWGWLRGERFHKGRTVSSWRTALLDKAPAARTNAMHELAEGKGASVPVLVELLPAPSDTRSRDAIRNAVDTLSW
jgi:hypothetical protein